MAFSLLDLSKHAVEHVGRGDDRRAALATDVIRAQLLSLPTASDELAGRKAADVAFNLALAGCDDGELYSLLCLRAEHELRRPKGRRAKSGLGVAHVAERLAAAGCRADQAAGLFDAALEQLLTLGTS
eukprot:4940205-Prymnesium_polylepis.1